MCGQETPKFVHRLSTEMTGVLLLARHQAAAAYAKDMIAQRGFWQRDYWALVCGRTPLEGQVSMPRLDFLKEPARCYAFSLVA